MYGQVTIALRPASKALLIPASCLVGPLKDGKGSVYVVRGGKASLTPVEIAGDDGVHLEVRKGLADTDDVVYHSTGPIGNDVPVTMVNQSAN